MTELEMTDMEQAMPAETADMLLPAAATDVVPPPEQADAPMDAAPRPELPEAPVDAAPSPELPSPAEDALPRPEPPEEEPEEEASMALPAPAQPQTPPPPTATGLAKSLRPELEEAKPKKTEETEEKNFKRLYWRKVLTGNPATVPAEVRRNAGVDEMDASEEQKQYRLLSTINRSWAADHMSQSREAVRADWPQQRAHIARRLRVRNNEQEVFLALSQEVEDEPRREAARRILDTCYMAGLDGKSLELPPDVLNDLSDEDKKNALQLAETIFSQGRTQREELGGLAERIANGLDTFAAMEDSVFPASRVAMALPDLLRSIDELADMDDTARNTALYLAAGMAKKGQMSTSVPGVLERVVYAMRRGASGLGEGILQGVSNMGITALKNIGVLLDNKGLERTSVAWDKRMQMLERLRRLSQDELRPLVLPEDVGKATDYIITAAEQTPAALLSCCGGAGFSALTLGAVGESVAAARARSPQTEQELQLYAGLLAGAIQAGIYMNLNRVGGRLLEQSIASLGRASGRGMAGYSLAGLNVLGSTAGEAAKLLAAGKLATAADLGAQEIASRLNHTASNIDWKSFGDNLTDIEANMHEAAGLLPFLLLGSGRLGLEHFRSTHALLGEGYLLERLGVPAEQVEKIINEPDLAHQSEMLQEALAQTRLFCGLGDGFEVERAMNLLHTDESGKLFHDGLGREFLKLPPEQQAKITNIAETASAFGKKHAEALRVWNEWRLKSPLAGQSEEVPRRILPAVYYPERPPVVLSPALREEQVRRYVNNLVSHSYLFLMNTFSVDTIHGYRRNTKVWQNVTEKARQKLLSEAVKCVAAICDGRTREASINKLNHFMRTCADKYLTSDYHFAAHVKRRKNSLAAVLKLNGKASPGKILRMRPEEQKAIEIVNAMYSGVYALAELVPQMPEFQSNLINGMPPGLAVTHFLCPMLGLNNSTVDVRAQQKTRNTTPMDIYSSLNAKQFDIYRRLTGNELEETVAWNGQTYVRGRRVNGTFTRWYPKAEEAMNDIAGNASLEYTDIHRPTYLTEELSPPEREFNLMTVMASEKDPNFTKVDYSGRMAIYELDNLWYGTVTSVQPGLNMRDDRRMTPRKNELQKNPLFVSPIAMASKRFETAIRRQLTSNLVTPLELMNLLVERGFASEEKMKELQQRVGDGYNFELVVRGTFNKHRAVDRRAATVLNEIVQSATDYAMNYFLGSQMSLQYPGQLASWVALQAFDPPPRGIHEPRQNSSPAANFIRERLPIIEQVRAAEQQAASQGRDVLSYMLEDMMSLNGPRNYEQGWRHFTGTDGGSRVIHGTPQIYWDILRSPLYVWKRMNKTRQYAKLRNYINKFCSKVRYFTEQDEMPAGDYAMEELDRMLRQYPEMHRYSASRIDEGRLYRMDLLNAPPPPIEPGTIPPLRKGTELHDNLRRGYELTPVDTWPSFITQEQSGHACLLLLDHLRSYVVNRPQADPSGIWWKNKLYGQFGQAPPGLENAYVSIHPMLPLLDKLREAGTLAESGKPMNVCGVQINGLDPSMKIGPISQASTYRMPGDDTRVYRLMPGDSMLDGTTLRSPYIVQCERGTYIGSNGIINTNEKMKDACIPLHLFQPSDVRITAETQSEAWARNSYRDTLENLMSLSWKPGESMAHKSAYVLEYILRLGEDSGFSEAIGQRPLAECKPEEVTLLNLMGDLISTICAENSTPALERLNKLSEDYRAGKDTMIPRLIDYLSSLRPSMKKAPEKKPPAKRRPRKDKSEIENPDET